MAKQFECIKDFYIDLVDDNGLLMDGKYEQIKKGSVWELEENTTTLTGAKLRLTELAGLNWIEMWEDMLEQYFKPLLSEDSE